MWIEFGFCQSFNPFLLAICEVVPQSETKIVELAGLFFGNCVPTCVANVGKMWSARVGRVQGLCNGVKARTQ